MCFSPDDFEPENQKPKKGIFKKLLEKLEYLHSKLSMNIALQIITLVFVVAIFYYVSR